MFDRRNSGQINFDDFGALWKYIIDWKKCFLSFDKDQSGNIDKSELQTALRTFGYSLSDNLVSTLVRKFDRHGNGTILFDDFIQCCVVLQVRFGLFNKCSIISIFFLFQTLTAAFRKYDTDQDGFINIHYEQFLDMVVSLKM